MGAGGAELRPPVASYAVMKLICGPILGSLSDCIGRKPVLLIGILGYAITMLRFDLATELWMLFAHESLSAEARQEAAGGREAAGLAAWQQALFSPLGILFVLTLVSTCGLMIFAGVFDLHAPDRFGFGPEGMGVMMMVLADGFVMVLLATAFFGVTTAVPALTSLTSERSTLSQGITMGLSNAFVSLGRIVGPLLCGLLLNANMSYPHVAGAGVMPVGLRSA